MGITVNIFAIALILTYLYIVSSTLFTIIKDKRDPVKSNAWIVVIISIPIIGFIIYLLFGQNHRKKKILSRKLFSSDKEQKKIVRSQLKEFSLSKKIPHYEIGKNRDLITLLLNNSRSPLTLNNYVEILNDGDDTFDKIIYELEQAKYFIHIEYYIVLDDDIGNVIADILIRKASEGVKVRFIYDAVGSWSLTKSYVTRLKNAGINIHAFMPVIFPLLTSRINNRNHRKIIVIDGDKGFTGGVNIADKYIHGLETLGTWRDTHIYIEGMAILSLHSVFATDWLFVTGEHLSSETHFKINSEIIYGNSAMQIASSGPDSDWQTIMQLFFCAITRAEKHIYISTPYFLPNNAVLTGIKVAAMSGLDVRLMIPKRPDSKLVYWATCSYILELLLAKVKIYLYTPGFNHSKIIMIDSTFSSIGTANMDVRSFEDNFEVSALLYDSVKTIQLETRFLSDLEQSEQVTIEKWKARKKKRGFLEGLARLFTPLL